jgi:hypothetical protein
MPPTTKLTIEKDGDTVRVEGTLTIADFRQAVKDARADLGDPLVEKFNGLVTTLAGK